MRFSVLLFLSLGLLVDFGSAQEMVQFGQNKVQYHSFDWRYYQTKHFDIYYPQGGERIARFAAQHVEAMHDKVAAMTGHALTARVPIILHNSHAEFEQTNVIPIPLDEAIGGFTEEFKNRIVLPFEGNYGEFYHVLKHEMTHAVMNDYMYGDNAAAPMTAQMGERLPLWLSEGLAEYTSMGWELGAEFFMIDATTFGYVESPVEDFGGFLAYKGGQLFLHFVEKVYGKGTITRLLQVMNDPANKERSLDKAFQKVTHTSLEEAGEIWLRELRYLYWPELGQRQYGKSVARKLTNHGRDRSFYNLQPSLSPNGEEIAFFSDRESWEAIYILNVKKEKVIRTVIQGGKKEAHESFHSFKSGITWSPDGKSLAIVSKQEGRDVIHILDAKSGKIRRILKPDDLQAILSPSWSRDGRYIAFSGQSEAFTDIYVFDLQTGALKRLTSDIAHDDKPVFSPSGKWIAFESDRPKPVLDPDPAEPLAWFDSLLPYKDIYRISVSGDSLTRIAGGRWDEKMPAYGPNDSLLYFVSNRSGLDNIYLWRDTAGGAWIRPVTNLLTGCFTPSLSYDGKQLVFSLFEAGGWDVYLMKDPLQKVQANELPKTRFIRYSEDSTIGFFRPPTWANLSSYKPDTAKDTTKAKKDSVAAVKITVPRDTLVKTDSTKADTTAKASIKPKKEKKRKEKPSPFLNDTLAYKDSSGNFISKPYETKWSLDAVNASVGVDNYYGASGLTYLTLSDLMGDQSISFALSINGTLDNFSGFLQYDYLPFKPDLDVMLYRQSQQTAALLAHENGTIFVDNATDLIYGYGAGIRYPLSTFTRFELAAIARFAKRTEDGVDYSTGAPDTIFGTRTIEINSFLPTLSWVQDNSQWGWVGPVAGHRMLAVVQYLPPLFQHNYSYVKAETDLRAYWEFLRKYTFAARVSAGVSEAVQGYTNPQEYVVGGESYTFNTHINLDNLPKTLAQYYFSDLDFPLRGYDFYEFTGTRKFLANLEFRYPFIREFTVEWPLPFSITNVMGNIFVDYGGAWSSGDPLAQMGAGIGYGMRLNLGFFVLKYTWAQAFDGGRDGNAAGTNRKLGSREYWSLGAEF